jgi:hypothetical protein
MTRRVIVAVVVLCAVGLVAAYGQEAAKDKPAAKLCESLTKQISSAEGIKEPVKKFLIDKCLPLIDNAVWAKEIQAQNDKKVPVEELKKIEKQWAAAEEQLPIQKEKLSNACAKATREAIKSAAAVREAFVMDNQGAIVGESNLTSGFWKGDHDKWRKAYNDAKGGLYVGKEALDKSANVVLQQISLPVIDAEGKVVGAVCLGIDVSKV